MDEHEVEIINKETRKEKIKNFLINKKKTIISTVILFLLVLFSFFFYQDYTQNQRELLARKYNEAIIVHESGDQSKILESMKNIIINKDKTYSPLALYYLLDNDLITSKEEINKYFDILIYEIGLDDGNKNLTIFTQIYLI